MQANSDSSRVYVGIDIGFKGGVAIIRPWMLGTNLEADVFPMPVRKSPKGKGKEYDIPAINELIPDGAFVFIEKQQPFPSQGSVSAGKLMEGQGIMLGLCAARQLSHSLVPPKVWQKHMFQGKPHKDTKAASVAECTSRFPFVSLTPGRTKVPQDGLSDALLLAAYGLASAGPKELCGTGVRWSHVDDDREG